MTASRNWAKMNAYRKVSRAETEEQAVRSLRRGTHDPDRVFERGGTPEELAEGLRLLGLDEED